MLHKVQLVWEAIHDTQQKLVCFYVNKQIQLDLQSILLDSKLRIDLAIIDLSSLFYQSNDQGNYFTYTNFDNNFYISTKIICFQNNILIYIQTSLQNIVQMQRKHVDTLTQNISTTRKTYTNNRLSNKDTQQRKPTLYPIHNLMKPSQKSNINTIILNNHYFRVEKSKINFYGKQPCTQSINLQNISKAPIKLFITIPKTSFFCINQKSRNFTLSMGMSKKITIQMKKIPQDDSCLDYFEIKTDKNSQKIELNWNLFKSTTLYMPLLDLQKVETGRNHNTNIKFRNSSQNYTKTVRISKDPLDNIQLYPDHFTLKPLQSIHVEIVISPQKSGVYHHKLTIQEQGQILQPLEIIYMALVCIYKIEEENGVVAKELDFGTLLRGTKKEMYVWANNSGPRDVQLRIKVKIGRSLRAQSTLQSPQELGIQTSSTVIEPLIKSLKIPAFSRSKVSLIAYLEAQQRQKQLVSRLARSQGLTGPLKQKLQKQDSQHQQVLVCQFIECPKPTDISVSGKINTSVVPMRVCFSLPTLKISPSSLNLGSILVEDSLSSSLIIENLSNIYKLSIQIGKILNSQCFINSQILNYKQVQSLDIITCAHNLGQFKASIDIIIASLYIIKIPIEYEVILRDTKSKLFHTIHQSSNKEQATMNLTNTFSLVQRQKNRKKYNFPAFRTSLVKNKTVASLIQPNNISSNDSLRKSSVGKSKEIQSLDKDILNDNICTPNQRLMSAHTKNYPLFVTKKIDKYLPFQQLKESKKLLKTRTSKDYFAGQLRRQPKNRKQAEEIERQLTSQELKQITISSKIISFGRIFVKSQCEKQWSLINQTEGSLFVQVKDSGNDPKKSGMISSSDFQPQIIPVHGVGSFKISLLASICGKFQTTISYTINNIHTFQLLLTAEVQLASLTLNKTQLKMGYADEQDLLLTQNFILKNEGNTTTRFSIVQPTDKYKISMTVGEIKPEESVFITVIQNEKYFPIIQAGETQISKALKNNSSSSSPIQERIMIKVLDGNDISLKVITPSGIADPRCLVKQSRINFGCTIVSKQKTKTFQLKNLSRTLSLFQIINEQCSEFLCFDCTKGRIPPEGNKEITVTYKSSVIHGLNSSFKILIKGRLIINVPISAQSIAPQIIILQDCFNFGEICCDTAVVRPISIKNNSQIPVQLFLDTRRRQRGVQYLFPSFWGANTQVIHESMALKKTPSLSNYTKGTGLQQEIIENIVREHSFHHIKVQPKSIYNFNLVFKPSAAGYYQFILPIFLQGYIRNDSLSKLVSCLVIQPRFIVQPSVITFKKKIINDKDNGCFHPFIEYLTLKNPTNHKLSWKLDLGLVKKSDSFTSYSSSSLFNRPENKQNTLLVQKSCFQIEQKRGQLGPKEAISINVSFNPFEQGLYFHKIPLLIYNQEKRTFQQEAQVRLEGEGKYPSLNFNRRQLLLPAVPLGIEAIVMFQIQNEGYQIINLKHRFEIADIQGNPYVSKGNLCGQNNLPEIAVVFPEGNKLTNNKKKLIAMIRFISRKVCSITCKLQIYDDATDCRIYSLPVSATADNSLLTTFSYLSDPENIYKFEEIPLQHDRKSKKFQDNLVSSIVLKSNDGRNLIDRYHNVYQSLSNQSFQFDCKIVKRWLNQFFRQEKVRQFPVDLVNNSDILLKLMHRLTGRKEFAGTFQVEVQGTKQLLNAHMTDKIQFYTHIIRLLKQINCLLNHIRPEFLLEKQQFLKFMSKDPSWKHYSSYYLKHQQILHKQSWLVLIYQLISQFWCQRQKIQPSNSKVQSNIYSTPQLSVLRWAKTCYQSMNQLQSSKNMFLSFGKDYKDCIAPINCLMKYALPTKKSQIMDGVSKRPITSAQFDDNIKILYQLLQKLNVVPLVYEDQYPYCSDKEIFLFMYQLYEILPQLLPKGPPIIFACELGQSVTRTIQIKNPSTKTVYYWVKIEGSKDFQAQDKESISIQPKGVLHFAVQFKARLSIQQLAYLSFLSKQQGEANSGNGTALVFQLRSNLTGRKSIKTLETITCPLYDSFCSKVLVQNPFQESQIANFTISLFEQCPPSKVANPQKSKSQNSFVSQRTEVNRTRKQFYCEIDSIKIKKGSAASMEIYFNPLRLRKTKCFLVFHDPIVGQFQYEVSGITEIPRPLQELRIQQSIWVGIQQNVEVILPVYNTYMLKCETLLQQRNSQKIHHNQQLNEQRYKLQLNMDPNITEHINFPSEVMLKVVKKEGLQPQNKLKLECNFSCVLKDLTLDFLLIGDCERQVQDVRRFRVAVNVLHRPITQQLFMTTTARKSLCQTIPIQNPSNKDWKLKTTMLDNESNIFSLKQGDKCNLKEFVVKKGQTQNINIYFQPKCVMHCSAKVIIHNLSTNEQIILNLKGVAEDPLSQNHIHIKAGTEESTLHTINITNPYPQKLVYKVISDVQFLQLPPQVVLEPLETTSFHIFAMSAGGASQVGFIKFVQPTQGRFFWYSITLQNADKKARQFLVQISSEVGNEVSKYIQFKNPFSKNLHFKVEYPKDAGLQASQDFTIAPHDVYQYRIKYKPQKRTQTEITLKAINRQVGVFIYKVKLNAKEQMKRKAFQINVQVGKSGHFDFKLENPRNEPLKVYYSISNIISFFVQAPQLLQPGENLGKIRFTPSFEGKLTCNVRVSGELFPTKYFQIEGIGIAPYSIETIQMKSRVGETTLQVIRFMNPNPKRTKQSLKVSLSQNDHNNFRLAESENKDELFAEIQDILGIPVEFIPKQKGSFEAVLTIQCFHYHWKYLLKGSTNYKQPEKIQEQIKTVCKEETIQRLKIIIPDYYQQPANYFDHVQIQHPDKKLEKLLKNWLKLKLAHPEQGEYQQKIIILFIKFKPKKIIKELAKLLLSNSKEEGPTLTCNIQLTALPNSPESIIDLEIEAIKAMSFDLNGLGLQATVSAKMLKGNNCEAERIGEVVRLRFKPTHLLFTRSKQYIDNLILENEEERWNYTIRFILKK